MISIFYYIGQHLKINSLYKKPEHYENPISNYYLIIINHISHLIILFRNSNKLFHAMLPSDDLDLSIYPNPDSYPLSFFCGEDSEITTIAIDSFNSKIAVGLSNGRIHIYSIELTTYEHGIENALIGNSFSLIKAHNSTKITGLYINTENLLVSGSSDRNIRVWDIENKKLKDTFKTDSIPIKFIEYIYLQGLIEEEEEEKSKIIIENGIVNNIIRECIVTVNEKGIINIWDMKENSLIFIMDHIQNNINFIFVINNKYNNNICEYLILISSSNRIYLYKMNNFMLSDEYQIDLPIIYSYLDDQNQLNVYDCKYKLTVFTSLEYPSLKVYQLPLPPPITLLNNTEKEEDNNEDSNINKIIDSNIFDAEEYVYHSEGEEEEEGEQEGENYSYKYSQNDENDNYNENKNDDNEIGNENNNIIETDEPPPQPTPFSKPIPFKTLDDNSNTTTSVKENEIPVATSFSNYSSIFYDSNKVKSILDNKSNHSPKDVNFYKNQPLSKPILNSTMKIILQKHQIVNDNFDLENELDKRNLTKDDIYDYNELNKIVNAKPEPRYHDLVRMESPIKLQYFIPPKQVDPSVYIFYYYYY